MSDALNDADVLHTKCQYCNKRIGVSEHCNCEQSQKHRDSIDNLKWIIIGLDKKNRIKSATIDDNTKEVNSDIADMVREGLRVLRIRAKYVTINDYWIK